MDTDQHPTRHPSDSIEQIESAVQLFFRQIDLPSTVDTPLLLAVSGGPDSLCMADAVLTLQGTIHVKPAIAHLNHGLRGCAAEDDAEFVHHFAELHRVPCIVGHSDTASLAREHKQSVEVAARRARYQFLASTAAALGARYIAVAHNADDQAETILLRLLRGTGISGLRGIRTVHPLSAVYDEAGASHTETLILRPLLGVSRAEIESYCRLKQLQPRHDATNDELHHMRNRIRHELLPLLEQYNPGIRRVLIRLAETAITDMEIIDYATQQAYSSVLIHGAQQIPAFDRSAWCNLPPGLQRAVLREAVRQIKGDVTDLKFAGIEEARAVLNSDARTAEIAILSNVRIMVTPQSFHLAAHGENR